MEDLLQVGAISTPHGIHGEAKIYPMTDDVTRFKQLKEVYLDRGSDKRLLHITSCKFFKQMVILKFQEFQTPEEIDRLRKRGLYITREQAVELQENEYFIADLMDLAVVDEQGNALGTITDVLSTGANDVYEITGADGRQILIPAIKDCIRLVDLAQGKMTVHLLPGLSEPEDA
jgi:16S rRNA processing protein RimM